MTFTARGIVPPMEQTRSTVDNNWEGVTQVAVQVGDVVKAYDVQASADDGYQAATITSENPFYWQNTDPLTVTAWYPYTGSSFPFMSVNVDQSILENYLNSDALIAENQTLVFGQPNELYFKHSNAKITVQLQPGGDVTQEYLAGAQINIMASVDDPTYSNRPISSITPYQNRTAILPPQTLVAGQPFILIGIGNEMYSYVPDINQILEGGTHYTYTITISEKQGSIELSCITTITAWEETAITGTANPDGIVEVEFNEASDEYHVHTLGPVGRYLLRGTASDNCEIHLVGDVQLHLENFHGGVLLVYPGAHPTIHLSGNNSLGPSFMPSFCVTRGASATIVGEDVNSDKNRLEIEGGLQVNDAELTIDNVTLDVGIVSRMIPAILLGGDLYPSSLAISCSYIYAKTVGELEESSGIPGIGYNIYESPSSVAPNVTISDSNIQVYRSEATYPGDYIGFSGSESYQGENKIQTKGTITNSYINMYTGETHDGYRYYDASGSFTEYMNETENNE